MIREFQETKGNKEMWKEAEKVMNPKPSREERIMIKLDSKSEPISDEKTLADEFNNFFIKKVKGLIEGIDQEKKEDPTTLLKNKLEGSLCN